MESDEDVLPFLFCLLLRLLRSIYLSGEKRWKERKKKKMKQARNQ